MRTPDPVPVGSVAGGEDTIGKIVRAEGIALGKVERALLGHGCCLAFGLGHVTWTAAVPARARC